jgi:hypothetical protein
MISIDGYTLTSWRRRNGVPIRTWEKPNLPAIIGIQIIGRAPAVTWTAREAIGLGWFQAEELPHMGLVPGNQRALSHLATVLREAAENLPGRGGAGV